MTTERDESGPRYVVLALGANEAVAVVADEARSALTALGRAADVRADLPGTPADGLVLVVGDGSLAPVLAAAESYRGRAVAAAIVGGERANATAVGHRVRAALRPKGAFVLDRQVWFPPEAFGAYGLESDDHRDRLHALLALLDHETERLHAAREGWEEADAEREDVEWIGPHSAREDD